MIQHVLQLLKDIVIITQMNKCMHDLMNELVISMS